MGALSHQGPSISSLSTAAMGTWWTTCTATSTPSCSPTERRHGERQRCMGTLPRRTTCKGTWKAALLLPGAYPVPAPVNEGGWYCQEGYLYFLQTSKINAGPALGHTWPLSYFVRLARVPTSHLQTAPGTRGVSRDNLCVLEAEFASTHAGCSMPVGNIPWHH